MIGRRICGRGKRVNFENQNFKERTGSAAGSASIDWVARARGVVPVIEGALDRIESERRVTGDVMAAMHDAELFRMCLPRSMGGGEADPLTVMLTTETLAAADASTAWCLGQGLGCSRSSGYLDPAVAQEVFGKPDAVLAWGPPDGKVQAVAVDGGYRVTGKWRFASGILNAAWLGPHCPVVEPDGTPRLDADGKPVARTMLLPKTSATVIDVWQVIGLRGTGSNSFAIDDLFVPADFSFTRDAAADRREDGRLYRMPLTTFYGIAFAGVALGIARTVFESFLDLAAGKTPSHNATVLRENPAVQRQVAQFEANLGSARSYLIERIKTVWDGGLPPHEWPLEHRARLRIASTNAVCQARDTVAFAYQAAGATAIFASNPFERRFRDMNTVAQQAQGQPVNFEHGGMALLGLQVKGGRV
jgi:alkylation response protein AidB-like acyl-CoA dehydrogenase